MKKLLITLITTILVVVTIAFGIYYNSRYIAPVNFKTTYLKPELGSKVPNNFNGVKILFFSDLEYGTLFDSKHLDKLKKAIDKQDFDIVLFGGDLFDKDFTPFSDDVDKLTEFLSTINAPLGKFAVLGEQDEFSDTKVLLVKKILNDGNFQLIDEPLKIYNGLSGHINLYSNSLQDVSIDSSEVNIMVSHNSLKLNSEYRNMSLVLTGNSHESQLNIFPEVDYKLGLTNNVYVTSGVGLLEKNYRMFDRPELVIVTLEK